MDFAFTEEQQAIGDLARQILTDGSDPAVLRNLERSGEPRFDRALWATLAETGVLAACLPEADGGAGLDIVALGAVLDAAGATVAAVPLWETLALGALPIAHFGSDELRAELLGGVADGSRVLTAAWHEPSGAPGDIGATVSGDGDSAVLTGTFVPVPAGMIASHAVVRAVAGDTPGLYVLDLEANGVTREALTTTMLTPDALVTCDGAPVQLLASGQDAVDWAFNRGVATLCAQLTGVCEAATRLTATYTTERKQFDTPIASFQAVAHRAADAYVATEGIRLTTAQALWRLSADLSSTPEVAIAKFWAAEGGQRVVAAAQHLHGGVGVDRDYPLHRYYLAAKQGELMLGGSSESLRRLGREIAAGTA